MSEYIKYKLKVMKQLGVKVSESQKDHVKHLNSEIAIDNYFLDMIMSA